MQNHMSGGVQSTLFPTCQAKVGMWKQIELNGENVHRGELIGRGKFSEVYKGHARGHDCAVKVYRSTASQQHLHSAMQEIVVAASLDHPCTVRVLGWVQEPLQMITELCSGDLKSFYLDKIDPIQYNEWQALRLLKVGFSLCACLYSAKVNCFPLILTHSTAFFVS